ncbi:MAG TPA: branched-chain amino acid ABC transporter permease [Eoetvoesiella sp.]|uniref:branched-chain amino acid ABC transporter permease n=1 Tax=Eoetvoesiella sp. TaxID=1966355 RepID=UPI002BD0CC27|nr:branched-chain amino acid ABC transporter permease [Eoetvoesiella sp.]HWK60085.1 branched-chain amino acid ABC transporter permease [Eoetvoesiella sp.]
MMPGSVTQTEALRIERWTRTAVIAIGAIVVALVVLAFGPMFLGADAIGSLTRLFIYVILAVMWNALAGYGGMVSIGQQGFFGLGAYFVIRLAGFGLNPYVAILVGAVGVGLLSVPISAIILKLTEGRFAIATWVVAELAVLLVMFDPIINGETGTSLSQLMAYSPSVHRALTYWSALGFMVALLAVMFALLRSPIGASIQAIRDDTDAAEAVGVKVLNTKRILYVLAAFGGAVAGALWVASTITFQPNSFFSVQWSAFMIFMALVGGIGTFEGAIVGAIIFFLVENFLGSTGVWYLIFLGATALAFALFLPRGIWGTVERRFGINLLPVGYRVRLEALRASLSRRP